MATKSSTATSLHTPTEPIEPKVVEEVKPMEQETVSLPKEAKEEDNPRTEELPSEAKQLPKPDEEAVDEKTERSAVETKDDSVVDIPVNDKIEVEKVSISQSHEHSEPKPVVEAVTGEPVTHSTVQTVGEETDKSAVASVITQPAAETVAELSDKPAVASVDEKQLEASKETDSPEPSVEVVEKPKESSDIVSTKESQVVTDSYEAVVKEVDVSVVPEVEEKPKEQFETTEQVESEPVVPDVEAKPNVESEPVVLKVEAKPEVEPDTAVPEVDVKPKELCDVTEKVDPEPVVPDAESKPKEHSEVAEQVENVENVEPILKQQESSEVPPLNEPEGATVNDTEKLIESKDIVKPESQVSKVEAKPEELSAVTQEDEKPEGLDPEVVVKQEEQTVVAEEVEKQKLLDSEVQAKSVEEPEAAEQIELKSTDEKIEPAGPDVEVKPEGETEVAGKVEPKESIKFETVADEGTLADKVEDNASSKEVQSIKEGESSATPLPEGKKENEGTEVAEVPSKGAEVEIETDGQEKRDTIKTEGEIIDNDVPSEVSQPVKVDDIKNVVSSAEVTERLFEGEITGKSVETVAEKDKEDNVKVETPTSVETSKDANGKENLEETVTTVTETIKESLDSGSAVKEENIAKHKEDMSEKENVEEMANSQVQDSELSSKDGGDAKTSRDLPTEVPAKSTQKQSHNILTKVKQSLVKAKKAIIGKSPSSKTLTSDKNGDIKVK